MDSYASNSRIVSCYAWSAAIAVLLLSGKAILAGGEYTLLCKFIRRSAL